MNSNNTPDHDDKELDQFLGPLSNNFEELQQDDEDPQESIPTIRPPEPAPKPETEYDLLEDRITIQPPETEVYPPPEFQNPEVNYEPEKGRIWVKLNRNHENFGNQLRAIMEKVQEIRNKFGIWSKQERDGENLLITFQFPPDQKTE